MGSHPSCVRELQESFSLDGLVFSFAMKSATEFSPG